MTISLVILDTNGQLLVSYYIIILHQMSGGKQKTLNTFLTGAQVSIMCKTLLYGIICAFFIHLDRQCQEKIFIFS